ncbi:MAG: hypothetical protein V4819_09450 [Verrucomicrobiota bacterium]
MRFTLSVLVVLVLFTETTELILMMLSPVVRAVVKFQRVAPIAVLMAPR